MELKKNGENKGVVDKKYISTVCLQGRRCGPEQGGGWCGGGKRVQRT